MEEIIWTDPAKNSLNYIWKFYAEVDPIIADKIVFEILQAVDGIIFKEQYQVEEDLQGD